MEYQLVIEKGVSRGDRLNARDQFTCIKRDWKTWKTLKGVENAKTRMDQIVSDVAIISFPDDSDLIKTDVETYREGIDRIEAYLQSHKFNSPNDYVNVTDILLRLREIKNEIFEHRETSLT